MRKKKGPIHLGFIISGQVRFNPYQKKLEWRFHEHTPVRTAPWVKNIPDSYYPTPFVFKGGYANPIFVFERIK